MADGRPVLAPLSRHDLSGTLLDRIAHVVALTPAAPAAVGPGATLTYAALDAAADRIASIVTERAGTGPEPIALLLAHDVLAPAAMVGVLRSGRAFCVLDAVVPRARNADLLARSGSPLLLTDRAHRSAADVIAAEVAAVRVVELGPPAAEPMAGGETGEAAGRSPAGGGVGVRAATPASLTWSSGSTGRPKGVLFDHRMTLLDASVNMAVNAAGPADRVAVVLPLAFGAGSAPLVWTLLSGGCMVLRDARSHAPAELLEVFADARVDVLHATPSLLRALSAAAPAGHPALAGLRLVTSGGEAAFGADLAVLRGQLAPGCRWFNRAGSSEAATISLWEHVAGTPIGPGPLPAGRPVPGVRIVVERPDGAAAEPGEVGELAVSSPWVAAGYWREPELSAARFAVAEPGAGEDPPFGPVRTIRGGDLGALLPDGTLVFRGRRDDAVKIRGYLVEPAEVEAHLRADPGLAEAAVAGVAGAQEGSTRLVAWVAPRAGTTVTPAALRRALADRLPAWMVPTTVVVLSELPHNERGKLDRSRLPEPPAPPPGRAPRSDYERTIAEATAQVLGLPGISVEEDFFAAGGDSLAAEELLARITVDLGVALPSSVFTGGATVAALAAAAAAGRPAAADLVTLRAGGDGTPLFCLAGAGGLALGFLPLTRRLAPDRAVHALQAHALEARGLPDWTIGRAAARAVRAVRAVSPAGPWILAGHSSGAFVAVEVARRLTAAGGRVPLLVLLDPRRAPVPGEAPEYLGETDPVPGSPLAGPEPGGRGEVPASQPAVPGGPWAGAGAGTRGAAALAHLRSRAAAAAVLGLTGLVPRPGVEQFDLFHRQGRRLLSWHRVRPWAPSSNPGGPGRVVLFRAADTAPDRLADPAALVDGDVEFRTVAGRHLSMLREPWVGDLGEQLADLLAAADGAGGAAPPATPGRAANAGADHPDNADRSAGARALDRLIKG